MCADCDTYCSSLVKDYSTYAISQTPRREFGHLLKPLLGLVRAMAYLWPIVREPFTRKGISVSRQPQLNEVSYSTIYTSDHRVFGSGERTALVAHYERVGREVRSLLYSSDG